MVKIINKNMPNSSPVDYKDFEIRNIVASASLGFKINLTKFNEHEAYKNCSTYENSFPGLIHKIKKTETRQDLEQMVALVFSSGKVVFTGAKKEKDIETSFEYMKVVCNEFKKSDSKDS